MPLYVRITIDGLKNERVVRGVKILPDHWDQEKKVVKAGEPKAKEFNKKIALMQADLQRHFDLVRAKSGVATPALVKESYTAAALVPQIRNEKVANIQLSESVDNMIVQFLAFYEKLNQAYQNGHVPAPERKKILEMEKKKIGESLEERVKTWQQQKRMNNVFISEAGINNFP